MSPKISDVISDPPPVRTDRHSIMTTKKLPKFHTNDINFEFKFRIIFLQFIKFLLYNIYVLCQSPNQKWIQKCTFSFIKCAILKKFLFHLFLLQIFFNSPARHSLLKMYYHLHYLNNRSSMHWSHDYHALMMMRWFQLSSMYYLHHRPPLLVV